MLKKINNKGFTIIEVLIVLAIAGVIMLVVFLAVPALQRNSRTTQYKAGAAAILAAANEYETNNNGLPPAYADITSTGDIRMGTTSTANSVYGKTQAGYTLAVVTAAGSFPAATTVPGAFTLGVGLKCSGNTAFVATARALAVGFTVETSGSTFVQQCIEG